jgi:hypothetical protein
MESKVCHKCKNSKPLVEFWLHKKSKDGYNWNCKKCEGQNKLDRLEKQEENKILEEQQKKVCAECNEAKTFTSFYKDDKGKNGLKSKCKDCIHKYKRDNRKKKTNDDNKVEVANDGKKTNEILIPQIPAEKQIETKPAKVAHNKVSFDKLKSIVEDKLCKLTITEQQFNNTNVGNKSKIDIISQCGHNSNVQVSNFIHHNTGVLCKKCRYEQFKLKGPNDYHVQESNAIKRVQELCEDRFVFHKCVEGSLVDFCVKPVDTEDDSWIPFQMKTTKNINNRIYSFALRKSYTDMYIFAFAVDDEKIWIINSNEIEVKTSLSIGVYNSIYKKYEVDKTNLISFLDELYINTMFKNTLDTFDIPICEYSQREQDFFKYRESIFPELEYTYPDIDNRPYDLTINSKYKIQDKVVGKSSKTRKSSKEVKQEDYYYVLLARHSNPYKLGDNSFYWFHLQDKTGSYIIPEQALFEHELINDGNNTDFKISSHTILYPYSRANMKTDNKTLWMNEHLYIYSNPEHMKIIHKMFE